MPVKYDREANPESWALGMSYSAAQPMQLQELRQAGISSIELTWHPFDIFDAPVKARCDAIVNTARELGIGVYSVHIPYGDEWDPSSADEGVRARLAKKVRTIASYAQEWGARVAVIHPSYEPIRLEERKTRLEQARRTLSMLAREAILYDVRLAVECLPRTCLGLSAAEIEFLLADEPLLGACCDVNHLFTDTPGQFIRQLGARIIATHMSDNDGVDERHWMPGRGVLQWGEILHELSATSYQGPFMYEVRVQPPQEVADSWRSIRSKSAASLVDGAIAVTDQASGKILVFDPAAEDWNGAGAVAWSWPGDPSDLKPEAARGWGLPTEAKLRYHERYGGLCVATCDSLGLAAIVSYPAGGSPRWSRMVGGNPHSMELLPDGNIAVAASTGGWIRVYPAGAERIDPREDRYAECALAGAHGLLWDSRRELLWAVGDEVLTAFRLAGTPEAPELFELPERRKRLPTPYGHDLSPAVGDDDRLWVTTNAGVYWFCISTGTWLEPSPNIAPDNREFVKSIGEQPSGQWVLTVPDSLRQPPGACDLHPWCTDTVFLYAPDDRRVRKGAAFYKARIWSGSR